MSGNFVITLSEIRIHYLLKRLAMETAPLGKYRQGQRLTEKENTAVGCNQDCNYPFAAEHR